MQVRATQNTGKLWTFNSSLEQFVGHHEIRFYFWGKGQMFRSRRTKTFTAYEC